MRAIRRATLGDASRMLEIYDHYVKHTPITFEYDTPSLKEFESRFKKVTENYPWIVCEEDKNILGYAYASPFRDRTAYQWTTESTAYKLTIY